jgi:hypothetical protein
MIIKIANGIRVEAPIPPESHHSQELSNKRVLTDLVSLSDPREWMKFWLNHQLYRSHRSNQHSRLRNRDKVVDSIKVSSRLPKPNTLSKPRWVMSRANRALGLLPSKLRCEMLHSMLKWRSQGSWFRICRHRAMWNPMWKLLLNPPWTQIPRWSHHQSHANQIPTMTNLGIQFYQRNCNKRKPRSNTSYQINLRLCRKVQTSIKISIQLWTNHQPSPSRTLSKTQSTTWIQ